MLLARAARRAKQRIPELDTLGIYLARHAHLWTLPTKSITDAVGFEAIESWFLTTAATATLAALTPTSPLSERKSQVRSTARDSRRNTRKAAS